jgi:hypothetical protein
MELEHLDSSIRVMHKHQLTLDFFIPISRLKTLANTIQKRESEYDTLSQLLLPLPVINTNRDTNIKATTKPGLYIYNMAHVSQFHT